MKVKRIQLIVLMVLSFSVMSCLFTACSFLGESKKENLTNETYDFGNILKPNDWVYNVGTFNDNEKMYLVISRPEDEETLTLLCLMEKSDDAWILTEQYELPELGEDQFLLNAYLLEDGLTFITDIATMQTSEDGDSYYSTAIYVSYIGEEGISAGEEFILAEVENSSLLETEYGMNKDKCEMSLAGQVNQSIYVTIHSEDYTQIIAAELDVDTNKITATTDVTEFELFSDLENYENDNEKCLIYVSQFYPNEKGNIEALYVYKALSEETWAVIYEYDLEKNKVNNIANTKIQNLMCEVDGETYSMDQFYRSGLSNDGKSLLYVFFNPTELVSQSVICGLSIEAIKKGDSPLGDSPLGDSPLGEEYQGATYDQYDTSDFPEVYRNKTAEEEKTGVYYEIFVRAFADSDGDGIGDFNGITAKLDYLKELGVDGIWLMPINESSSYHGYDVKDYYNVNPDYGTEADFENLIAEAHKRDIKIIMDLVLNHTGADNAWFEDALTGVDSEYRNYYRWTVKDDTLDYSSNAMSLYGDSAWRKVGDAYYYAIFTNQMPDLNYNNEAVREEVKSIAEKYLAMGVDGFRLDAAIHIYGAGEFAQMKDRESANLQWWNEFSAYCESINPNAYIVGEAWEDDNIFAQYAVPFDSKFNFSFQEDMIYAISQEKAETIDGKSLGTSLEEIRAAYDEYDENFLDAVFATNHDQDRLMSQVGTTEKSRLAANIYLSLPGNPFIYYGEEIGMIGSGNDEYKRTGFLWEDDSSYNTSWIEDDQNGKTKSLLEQQKEDDSLYHTYQKIIAFRGANDALLYGDFQALDVSNDAVLAYTRSYKEETLMVLHNLSGSDVTISLAGADVRDAAFVSGGQYKINGDKIVLGAYTSLILK